MHAHLRSIFDELGVNSRAAAAHAVVALSHSPRQAKPSRASRAAILASAAAWRLRVGGHCRLARKFARHCHGPALPRIYVACAVPRCELMGRFPQ